MTKKIKLKDKKTGEILNLDTPICFVANEYSWEFESIKELVETLEDVEDNLEYVRGKLLGGEE